MADIRQRVDQQLPNTTQMLFHDNGDGTYSESYYITGGTIAVTESGVWTVSGPLTDEQLRAAAVAVSGPLTDEQLRATAVPVSGTFWQTTQPVSGTFWQATQPVSGTFWQAKQPVSVAAGDGAMRFVDESGAAYGVKHINNKPRVSSMPYLYDVAEGNVSGHAGWSKIGYNPDVGTAEEDLWTVGGSYVPPAAAIQMQVISSSANDDGDPVGTGVRTVIIYYLDAAYASKSETVTLNGVSAVNTTATDIFRVQGLRAATCGSGGKAAGNISLQAVGGGVTYSQIQAGYTRARNITYTIPASKALYITSTTFGVYGATKGIRFTTRATYDADAAAVRDFFIPYFEVDMGNGAFYRPLEIPARFPATVMIKVSAIADAAGGGVLLRLARLAGGRMTDYLLAAILAVLVAQNAPRAWDWLKRNGRHWLRQWRRRR